MTKNTSENELLNFASQLPSAKVSAGGANAPTLYGWQSAAVAAGKVGIDAQSVWATYTGRGVSVGIFDDGAYGVGKHATAVHGVLVGKPAAEGGPAGVAFGATASVQKVIGLDLSAVGDVLAHQRDYDVVNHSWGYGTPFAADAGVKGYDRIVASFADATAEGRSGLGTVISVAAGNYKDAGVDVNASNFTNDRHVVTVGAVTSEGGLTDYSSTGAAVLVSAPSGGGKEGGVLTTDLAGAKGYSDGDVTSGFSGTSAAAPEVSGVAALMLEANASLGWRDVKSILALSARQVDASPGVVNHDVHYNGGGHAFSNDVGYGLLDARAAVRLAETWTSQSTSDNEASVSGAVAGVRIKDLSTTTFTIHLDAGVCIESVSLAMDAWHGRVSDLKIELISPTATVSTLLAGQNGGGTFNGWTLTSNAFLGEESGGNWTVRITDSQTGQIGLVNAASLTVHGAATTNDERFVYTEDFGKSSAALVHLAEQHQGGIDEINAAALTSGSHIDLNVGAISVIDGRALTIDAGSEFDAAYGGDGDDTIVGNGGANLLWGGRGDDHIHGGAGNDIIVSGAGNDTVDGGAGVDTLRLSGHQSDWKIVLADMGESLNFTAQSTSGDHDVATNVERVFFDDSILAFDSDESAGQGYRIYQAAFDRTPDEQGLTYWVRQLDKGMDLKEVAFRFMDSNEFHEKYGTSVSNGDFVESLYENVLHRGSEQEGFDFWVNALADQTFDRADVLVRFSESHENVENVDDQIAHGVTLSNEYLSF